MTAYRTKPVSRLALACGPAHAFNLARRLTPGGFPSRGATASDSLGCKSQVHDGKRSSSVVATRRHPIAGDFGCRRFATGCGRLFSFLGLASQAIGCHRVAIAPSGLCGNRVACWVLLVAAISCLSNTIAKCDEEEVVTVAAGPEDPQTQILTRYIRVNSALARRVCKLSDEQEQQLAALDDAWLKAECQKLLKAPKEGAAAAGFARMFGLGGPPPVRPDAQPQQIIGMVSQEIDKKIKSCLDEEQAEAFKNELNARLKFRRESHAAVIVGILDKRLFLTDDQRVTLRDAIAASLGKDVAWSMYLMNENYLPTISRPAIAKVLDKEQLAALSQWRSADFESFQFEQQMIGQQEQFVIEK